MTDERTLAFLRELERADEDVSATIAELDELTRETEAVRTRALELEAFLLGLPAERERLALAASEAEGEAADAARAVVAAEEELARAERRRDAERLMRATRGLERARDALQRTERRVNELRERGRQLEEEGEAAERETGVLEGRAREVARSLRGRPRLAEDAGTEPGPGLAAIADWGSRARYALFVARGGLAAEREALVRQANEVGAVVLGEPVSAVSASVVARRVEQARERG